MSYEETNYKDHKEGELIIRKWSNGDKEWIRNGKRHRDDGPAIEFSDGHKEWFLNGTIVYNDYFNYLEHFPDLTESFKKSIILYELRKK